MKPNTGETYLYDYGGTKPVRIKVNFIEKTVTHEKYYNDGSYSPSITNWIVSENKAGWYEFDSDKFKLIKEVRL